MNVPELLAAHGGELRGFVAHNAGGAVLRFETVDDLLQGIAHEALRSAASFQDRGQASGRAWLYRVARRHLADRRAHWRTSKRSSGRLLRLDGSQADGETAVADVAASQTGTPTRADRRARLVQATRALALLLPRDRALVEDVASGVPIADTAARQGTSYAAAAQARGRALERFRKTYRLITSRGNG